MTKKGHFHSKLVWRKPNSARSKAASLRAARLKHPLVGLRKPNNNPSTRGKQMK